MQSQERYSIDAAAGTFEDRVFLGGNYIHGALLKHMAEAVRDCRFTPIIVWEFGIQPGTERDSSYRLLEQCKLAIFEVSTDGGHIGELEQAVRYGTITLCVWDASTGGPRMTAIVQANPFFDLKKGYTSIRELSYLVYDFLRSQN